MHKKYILQYVFHINNNEINIIFLYSNFLISLISLNFDFEVKYNSFMTAFDRFTQLN